MECMCAQIRPWFIISSEKILGSGVRTRVNSKEKFPSTEGSEEGWKFLFQDWKNADNKQKQNISEEQNENSVF